MRGRDRCRCGSALALHGCGFCSGLLRLDRGVGQTIAALDQIFEPLGETCCRSPIDDIVMDLAESLAFGCSDFGGHDLCTAIHVRLNIGRHVHILKQDEVLPTFATCLHGFVLIDGFCHAGNDESCERQGLPGDNQHTYESNCTSACACT